MDKGIVSIRDLRLRVPGLSEGEARAFGEDVARAVFEGMPRDIETAELGELNLKVRIPAGTPRGEIAKLVAEKILRALR